MGKKLLAVMAAVFCVSSAALGYAGYQAAVKAEAEGFALDQFRWIISLTSDYAMIEDSGMEGGYFSATLKDGDSAALLNREGQEVDRVDLSYIQGWKNCYRFTKGDKMGCRYADGSVMIPAEFDDIRDFDGGYALAQKDGKDVAINTAGEVVYRFEGWEDTVSHVDGAYFCEEAAGGVFRVIDVSDGSVVREWRTSECSQLQKCAAGIYAAANANDVHYFMNNDFEIIFDGKLFEDTGQRYSEGLIYGEWIANGSWEQIPDEDERQIRRGYFDYHGDLVVEIEEDSIYEGEFSDGKALIYGRGKVWCVDKTGRKLFEMPLKKKISSPTWNGGVGPVLTWGYILPGCRFSGGMAPLYDGEKMGLIDEEGNWLMEPVFDDMDVLGFNWIAVEYRGMWGVLDGGDLLAREVS